MIPINVFEFNPGYQIQRQQTHNDKTKITVIVTIKN